MAHPSTQHAPLADAQADVVQSVESGSQHSQDAVSNTPDTADTADTGGTADSDGTAAQHTGASADADAAPGIAGEAEQAEEAVGADDPESADAESADAESAAMEESQVDAGYLDDLDDVEEGLGDADGAEPDSVPEVPVVRWLGEEDATAEETQRLDSVTTPESDSSNGRSGDGATEVAKSGEPTTQPDPEASASDSRSGTDAVDAEASEKDEVNEIADDDEFIEQLRKVVNSQAPAAASEEAMAAFFDHDENASRGGVISGQSG